MGNFEMEYLIREKIVRTINKRTNEVITTIGINYGVVEENVGDVEIELFKKGIMLSIEQDDNNRYVIAKKDGEEVLAYKIVIELDNITVVKVKG
ncbi:MAG: hypothetical protein ACRC28_18520 [Clostridium sp.]|uniref:hypothetical protein n=1 Tax=Clostridium sp. TaxID=1506 RepID=UPI003F2AC748